MMGSVIYCVKIPKAFEIWFEELRRKYKCVTIEFNNGQIVLCRVRTPVEDVGYLTSIKDVKFGKLVFDDAGIFLERTFWPLYYAGEDVVRSKQ